MHIYPAGTTMDSSMEEHILKRIGKRLLSFHYVREGGMDRRTFKKTVHYYKGNEVHEDLSRRTRK